MVKTVDQEFFVGKFDWLREMEEISTTSKIVLAIIHPPSPTPNPTPPPTPHPHPKKDTQKKSKKQQN